ncbi:MAG UNVERIFIED_CONTAM: hypothetical protein LVQ98_07990 [Rickettsiaceae bacterium]|jgi:exodeoxyribonuclease V alpha subunit
MSDIDSPSGGETQQDLSGIVEKVIRHNPESGLCVIKALTKKEEQVIIKCIVPDIAPGESFKASGIWQKNSKISFFKASYFKPILPSDNEGIYKFLSSSYMQNIGPYYAKKLVEKFGDKVFSVIEFAPALLTQIQGIGLTRAKSISANWQRRKVVREIMTFLQYYEIPLNKATSIYRKYKNDTIAILNNNPYRLSDDIGMIDFRLLDNIAQNLAIAPNAPIRIEAGVKHILSNKSEELLSIENLIIKTEELLKIDRSLIEQYIKKAVDDKKINVK